MEKEITIKELVDKINKNKVDNDYVASMVVSDDTETTTVIITTKYGNGLSVALDTCDGDNVDAERVYKFTTINQPTFTDTRKILAFFGITLTDKKVKVIE